MMKVLVFNGGMPSPMQMMIMQSQQYKDELIKVHNSNPTLSFDELCEEVGCTKGDFTSPDLAAIRRVLSR